MDMDHSSCHWMDPDHPQIKIPTPLLPVCVMCHLYPVPVVGTIYVSQKLLGKFLLT